MRKLLLLLPLVLLLNSGCATTSGTTPTVTAQTAATQTLSVVGTALKATPAVLDTLYNAGKITKDTYNQAATAYNQALAGYQLAINALDAAVAAGQDPSGSSAYLTALAQFVTSQANLNNLLVAMGQTPVGGVK